MSSEKKTFIRRLVITFTAGLLIAAVIMFFENISNGEEVIRKLADGFTVAAVVLLGIGGLSALGRRGEYDSIGYLGYSINPFKKNYRSYTEYREEKAKQRETKPPSASKSMLIAGGALLVIAVIFLIIYYV